ncbi:ABC transporter permease [Paenarthrobacter nicotinovorans]|uniref:ABC transporter permease n=1 Tax=Paenarthrobacter TaxID=1742992 RepID=UPI0009A7EA0A|nr:ABC transporter permease subunit [Paenarthrobacter nicotinovorans]MDI2022542.1 putative aliphatic sulfonates transport permease protein SsuC [Paenarthrobacter nicotinovorans]SKB30698.1 ABC-type nitrate/sulfonate/bicarbonate transport system, permease component [Arthrobacter sp. 31Cvi3.1E]
MKASVRPFAFSIVGVVGALVIWQLLAEAKVAGTALPPATTVFATLATILGTGTFWSSLGATIGIALLALALSAVAGVAIGLLVGSFESVKYATLAVLEFLKPVPPIVILPLAVLVLGPTAEMSLFLVVFGCLLPIVMQTVDGVQGTDPVARDTARSYGMGEGEILARVVLPSAMPYIGTAMRVAAPAALVVTVVAGLLGGGPGLGQNIYQAQAAGDYAGLYGLVIVLGVLGLLFQGATRLAERRVLHWHESYREVVPR